MPSRSFELSADIQAPVPDVVAFLLDLRRHLGLHALMVAAEPVASGRDAQGQEWTDWTVTDHLPLGPWRVALRYPARLTRVGTAEVRSEVRAALGTRLSVRTRVEPLPGRADWSRMTEVTVITAPRLTLAYAARQAHAAHARTFLRLPDILAAQSGA